jgi:4-diphosphocytidyl-2C-methyl-D-erythritol kinase
VLVLPVDAALSTAAVYARADAGRLRTLGELAEARERLRARDVLAGPAENDLGAPARALCPAIDGALRDAAVAGADDILVSGSGPTVLGLFIGGDGPDRARAAAAELVARRPAAVAAEPVPAGWGRVTVESVRHTATGGP